MSLYHEPPTAGKSQAIIPAGNLTCVERDEKIRLPEQVATTLAGLVVSAKEGLLALAVTVGLKVFQVLMEEEVTEVVGPKGRHNPERQAVRHGYEKGSVVLGGRKVEVEKPRARTLDGRELLLESYRLFQKEDPLIQAALERMLHGLSTRNYHHGLEPCGEAVESKGTSKSAVSRRFIERTRTALAELLTRPLEGLVVPA